MSSKFCDNLEILMGYYKYLNNLHYRCFFNLLNRYLNLKKKARKLKEKSKKRNVPEILT